MSVRATCPPSEAHRAFNRQPVWKRIAVLLAGPAFNLMFAVAVYWVLFMAGVPSLKPIIGDGGAGVHRGARRPASTKT